MGFFNDTIFNALDNTVYDTIISVKIFSRLSHMSEEHSFLQKQAEHVRTQVRMPPVLHDALSAYAVDKGVSLNTAINVMVEFGLEWYDVENSSIVFGTYNGETLEKSAVFLTDFFQKNSKYKLINVETINRTGILYWYTFPKKEDGRPR